jgi:hypothetical protein
MNHPIIKKETLKLIINQLEKYNEELDYNLYECEQEFKTAGETIHFILNASIDGLKAEIKMNDSLLQELYQLYEIKY